MSSSSLSFVSFPHKEGFSLLYFADGLKPYWDARLQKKEGKVDQLAQQIFSLVGLCHVEPIIPKENRNSGFWQKVYKAFLIKRKDYTEKCHLLLTGLFHQTISEKFKNASAFSGQTKLESCKEFFKNHPMPVTLIQALCDNGRLIKEDFEGDYGQFLKGWKEEETFATNLLLHCVNPLNFLPSFNGKKDLDLLKFTQFVKSRAALCKSNRSSDGKKWIDWPSWYDVLYQWALINSRENFERVNDLFRLLQLPLVPISQFKVDNYQDPFPVFLMKESCKIVSSYFDEVPAFPKKSIEVCLRISEEARKKILLCLALEISLELPIDRPIVRSFLNFLELYKNPRYKNLSYCIFDHHLTEKEWELFSQNVKGKVPDHLILQAMQTADFLREELEGLKAVHYLTLFMRLIEARDPKGLHRLLTLFFQTFPSRNRSFAEIEKTVFLLIEKSLKLKNEALQMTLCEKLKGSVDPVELGFPLYFFVEVLFKCTSEEELLPTIENLRDSFCKEKLSLESNEAAQHERELFFDYFQGHSTYNQMIALKAMGQKLSQLIQFKLFKMNHKTITELDLRLGRSSPYRAMTRPVFPSSTRKKESEDEKRRDSIGSETFEIHEDLSSELCSSDEEDVFDPIINSSKSVSKIYNKEPEKKQEEIPSFKPSLSSQTMNQVEFINFVLDHPFPQIEKEMADFLETISSLKLKYDFDSMQIAALIFSYFPRMDREFKLEKHEETFLVDDLNKRLTLLVQQQDLLLQIENLVNHKISSENAFQWLMYAPSVEDTNKILKEITKTVHQMDDCLYTNPILSQTVMGKLFDWNDENSLPSLKPASVSSRTVSDHYKNAFKKGGNALAKEIAFATVPYTFQMISDFLKAEAMHPRPGDQTKINSLISLSKGLQEGLAFFAEWEIPKKRWDHPALILSAMNLTTDQATVSRFILPWSEEEIEIHPQLMKNLHEAALDENTKRFDKKIHEYLATIKINIHFCLRWLSLKKKPTLNTAAFPTTFLFFGSGNAIQGEHCFSFDHTIPEWLKPIIPQIADAVKNHPCIYKKRYSFIPLQHPESHENIDLEFIAHGNVNEVTLTLGDVSQTFRYYDQIHQKNFPSLITAQTLMLLAKRHRTLKGSFKNLFLNDP